MILTVSLPCLHLMRLPVGIAPITSLLFNPGGIQFPALHPCVPIHGTVQIMIQYNSPAAIRPGLHITLHSIHLMGLKPIGVPSGGPDPCGLNDHSLTGEPISTGTPTLLCIVQQCTGLPNMDNTPNIRDINTHPQCGSGHNHTPCTALKPVQHPSLVNLLAMICLTFQRFSHVHHHRDCGSIYNHFAGLGPLHAVIYICHHLRCFHPPVQ